MNQSTVSASTSKTGSYTAFSAQPGQYVEERDVVGKVAAVLSNSWLWIAIGTVTVMSLS